MHSAHCTGYKGNEQNEHIHKNLFSSSIYVFFLLFFTIAFYLYAQIYNIILVLCFSPFETGVSLSGKAEKNLHALHSSFFIFSFITNNHCVYGHWRLLPAFTLENRSRTKCDRTNRERDDEEDENKSFEYPALTKWTQTTQRLWASCRSQKWNLSECKKEIREENCLN